MTASGRNGLGAADSFRATLAARVFIVTAELECPRNASAANVTRQADAVAGLVDAIDCTDNSAATVRMSPVAAATIAAQTGVTTLIQLSCRDRNLIALQSDILGAAAAGAAGVVCITGDPPATGSHADAAGVYDVDSIGLIRVVRGLAAGRFAAAGRLDPPLDLVAGCVENPADGPASVARLAAKVEAGAEFVQTQISFDVEQLAGWMRLVRAEGLHTRLRVLVGIAPVRRPAIARFLSTQVPGVTVPERVRERLARANDPAAEGVQIAAELLRSAREIDGVGGAHLLTFGWAAGVRRVLQAV